MVPVKIRLLVGLALAATVLVGCNGNSTSSSPPQIADNTNYDITRPDGPSASPGGTPGAPAPVDDGGTNGGDPPNGEPPAQDAPPITPPASSPEPPVTPPAAGPQTPGEPPVTPPPAGPKPPVQLPTAPPLDPPPIPPPPSGGDNIVDGGSNDLLPPVDPDDTWQDEEQLADEGHSPEPATMMLLLASGLGAGAMRLYRRRRS